MAVLKFSEGRHFKRAAAQQQQQQQHSNHSTKDNKNKAANNKARSSFIVRSSVANHIHLVIEQQPQPQPQTHQQTIEQQREKLFRHAKRRISRGLMEEYENENQNENQNQSQTSFMERQDINGQLRNVSSSSKLELGEILGMGAFAQVRVVKSFKDEHQSSSVYDDDDDENKHEQNEEQLVVKMLRPDLFQAGAGIITTTTTTKYKKNNRTIASIASDLVKEGAILAKLSNHTNILKLIGCNTSSTTGGLEGFFNINNTNNNNTNNNNNNTNDDGNNECIINPNGFVLVLERLSGNLTEKFSEWRHHSKQLQRERVADIVKIPLHHHRHRHHHHHSKDTNDEFWIERLDVCKQLANGIDYLHSNRIVHRDLKPDNVGFDYNNTNVVKIFDFNVARKLPSSSSSGHHQDDLFHLTHQVGSRRYMAKEVGMKQHGYNQKVDIYSFGLLAYQILVLPQSDKVFPDIYTVDQHERRVFVKGERPIIPHNYNKNLTKIIQRSWSDRISERPSAKVLKDFFTNEIDHYKKQSIISKQQVKAAGAVASSSAAAKTVRSTNKMISTSTSTTSTSTRLRIRIRIRPGDGGNTTLRFVSRRIWYPIFRGGERRPPRDASIVDDLSSCWSSESWRDAINDDKEEESSLLLYNQKNKYNNNKYKYNKQ